MKTILYHRLTSFKQSIVLDSPIRSTLRSKIKQNKQTAVSISTRFFNIDVGERKKRDLTLSQPNPAAFHPGRHQPSILLSKNLRLRKPQTQDSFIFPEQNASQKAPASYRPSECTSRPTIKVF
ncbi:hypothetical protein TNCV_3902661 [Trichonephila clavipes]|nr:hypothetical protein TNCV_3902661 [Trichonephila clavipes]